MTIIITWASTLLGLKGFVTTIVVVVGLVWNMLSTIIFLGQLGAWSLKLKQIMQGYFNGTLTSLTCCVLTLVTSSTTSITSFFLFLLWHVYLAWSILP